MDKNELVLPMKVGNTVVNVRVRPDPSELASTEQRVAGGHLPDFSDVTNGIESLCSSLGEVLAKVAPKKASVEFNVGITLKTGKLTALFLEGETEGSIKITLEWESSNKAEPLVGARVD